MGEDARYAQPFGGLYATVMDGERGGVTDVWQGNGHIEVYVPHGRSVRIELVSRSGQVSIHDGLRAASGLGDGAGGLRQVGDDWVWNTTIGVMSPATPTMRIWQGAGELAIIDRSGATQEETRP